MQTLLAVLAQAREKLKTCITETIDIAPQPELLHSLSFGESKGNPLNQGFCQRESDPAADAREVDESQIKRYFGSDYDALTLTQKEKIAFSIINKTDAPNAPPEQDIRLEDVLGVKLQADQEQDTLELSLNENAAKSPSQKPAGMDSLELSGIVHQSPDIAPEEDSPQKEEAKPVEPQSAKDFRRRLFRKKDSCPTGVATRDKRDNLSFEVEDATSKSMVQSTKHAGVRLARRNIIFAHSREVGWAEDRDKRPTKAPPMQVRNSSWNENGPSEKSFSEFTLSAAKAQPALASQSVVTQEKRYPSPKIAGKNKNLFDVRKTAEGRSRRKQLLQTPQFNGKGEDSRPELGQGSGMEQLKEINDAIAKIIEDHQAIIVKPMSAASALRRDIIPYPDASFAHGTVVNINIQKQTNYGNMLAQRSKKRARGFLRVRPVLPEPDPVAQAHGCAAKRAGPTLSRGKYRVGPRAVRKVDVAN